MQDNVTQALPVIQADREAAADFHKSNSRKMFAENYAEAIRQGLRDSDSMVQAFAAHRIASTTAQTEAVQTLVEFIRGLECECDSYHGFRCGRCLTLAAHRESQP